MAVLLAKSGALFLHIPKTGGTWFIHAMDQCGIKYDILAHHATIARLIQTSKYNKTKIKYVFSIVRHPITWYQSRWAFRLMRGWNVDHPLDYMCASNNFHKFVYNVIDYMPSGWVSYLYRSYNEHVIKPDFICRLENLANDLEYVLDVIGEDYDKDVFRSTAVANKTVIDGKPSGYWAKYDSKLYDLVWNVEQHVINKYYCDYHMNKGDYIS